MIISYIEKNSNCQYALKCINIQYHIRHFLQWVKNFRCVKNKKRRKEMKIEVVWKIKKSKYQKANFCIVSYYFSCICGLYNGLCRC